MSQFSVSHHLHPHPDTVLPFADSRYLLRVIGRLNRERLKQGLSHEAVARRARLHRSVIEQAERGGLVPDSRDFKAWSTALGLSWNQIWSDSLPGDSGPPIEHLT